ncbi:MAG: PspC domain-containing protein [Bacteroidales bacterium]|nr:PspC domain-containing protein [Bacteroidales bacterium]
MKKTFNINISGIIFHIDEDAYEKLNAYLKRLKQHFTRTDGSEDIIKDIESRIAELLQEKITDKKQVVSLNDIDEVISVMGEPFEFSEENEKTESQKYSRQTYKPNYGKRLYRDTEDRILGGVCSGIAAYFNIDSLWVRLAFVVAAFSGFGFLIYIVLWIAIPEARTTRERLEMRGEEINISNIEKSIRDEFDHIKTKINDLTDQAKQTYKKKSGVHRSFFEEILNAFISIFKGILKVIVVLIGIILVIIGFSLIITFFAAFFGWGGFVIFGHHDLLAFDFPFFFDLMLPGDNPGLFKASIMMVLGIPLLMLLYGGIRLIFGVKRTRFVGMTAFNVWLIGLIILVYFSFTTYKSYRSDATVETNIEITQPISDIVYLSIYNDGYFDTFDHDESFEIDDWNMIITNEGNYYLLPTLEIKKSDSEKFELIEYSYARGSSRIDAKDRAENTEYDIAQTDSSFIFDPYFEISDNLQWRGQELNLVLKIPVGKKIHFANDFHTIINNYYYDFYYGNSGKTFIMTDMGLKEVEEKELSEIQQ